MRKHHPKNERIKHKYLAYLEEAKRMSSKSADGAAAAIALFEASTNYKDFQAFHIEQARRFKRQLAEAMNPKTKKPLAKATIHSRLLAVKAFFFWLAGQPGYKSRISYSDCDYFNPSANDSRIATARREKPSPEIEQIRLVLNSLPDSTAIEKRDRALIAFTLLSGARDDAIASLNIRQIDIDKRQIFQDARTVRTKNRKTTTSTFFPVGDDIEKIVTDWITYLKTELVFGDADPLFPATKTGLNNEGHFAVLGLSHKHWRSAGSIRKIFKDAFEAAGLLYFHPHSFRHTLAKLGERICSNPEEMKAWSQNLGHEKVLTTLTSYGAVSSHRQTEIMSDLSIQKNKTVTSSGEPDAATIAHVVEYLQKKAS